MVCSHSVVGESTIEAHDHCCNHEHDSQHTDESPEECPTNSPCDGSHDCDEPQCTFVVAPLKSLDNEDFTSQWVSYVGDALSQHQFMFVAKSNIALPYRSSSPPESGVARCAILQSWQI
ncbi:MAG: hypothetical protein SFV81_00170 [Pirellulaceae bacterium]|nr:hypothetical protein [Pirellulaceae bacterium]